MKDVFVLHTGGTIGMERGPRGWRTSKPNLERQLELIRQQVRDLPSFDLEHTEVLYDSSQIHPSSWNVFGAKIWDRLPHYRGVVVLHGTDTMAYTASALAFMLGGLGKPVVLTGSQRPLVEAGSDGRDNFVSAVRTAAFGVPRDVCIAFGGRLLRGCRATKVSATRDTAFDSPNYAPLAAWLPGEDITAQLRSTPVLMSGAAELIEVKEPLVVATRFFPGLSATLLGDLVKPREPALRGLVLEMFGTGNGPTHQEFIDVLVAAHRAKVAVVAVSQCLHGEIDWVYEAGTPYRDAHVISGRDMTTEAAVAKLTVLASQDDYEELRKKMATNLRGEMKDS